MLDEDSFVSSLLCMYLFWLSLPGMQSNLVEAAEDSRPRSQRTVASPNDIYALVKQYMHDEHLSQPPLLVFPVHMAPLALRAFERMNEVEGHNWRCFCRQSVMVDSI
jgi:hypothetical protein